MRCRRSCPRPSTRCPEGSCSGAPTRTRRGAGRGSRAARSTAGSGRGRSVIQSSWIAWRKRCAGKTPGSAAAGSPVSARVGLTADSLIVEPSLGADACGVVRWCGRLAPFGYLGAHGEKHLQVVSVAAPPPSQEKSRPWVGACAARCSSSAAGLIAVAVAWPTATIGADDQALASVKIAPALASTSRSVTVTDSNGHRGSGRGSARARSVPLGKLAFRRAARRHRDRAPLLAGRLAGRRERAGEGDHRHADDADVRSTLLHLASGAPGRRSASAAPASVVVAEAAGLRAAAARVREAAQVVLDTGVHATGAEPLRRRSSVATAARPWEKLSAPVHVSWFPAGHAARGARQAGAGHDDRAVDADRADVLGARAVGARPRAPDARPARRPAPGCRPRPNRSRSSPPAPATPLGRHVVVTLPDEHRHPRAGQHADRPMRSPGASRSARRCGSSSCSAELGYLPLTWAARAARRCRRRRSRRSRPRSTRRRARSRGATRHARRSSRRSGGRTAGRG